MGLACVLSVIASLGGVTVGSVSMMRRFLMLPAIVVFRLPLHGAEKLLSDVPMLCDDVQQPF